MKTKTPKDLNGNPTPLTVNFVKSTMTRATETANIILKHFPEIQDHQSCDMIREGAPCPPDPPYPEWDPSPSVSSWWIKEFMFLFRIWNLILFEMCLHHSKYEEIFYTMQLFGVDRTEGFDADSPIFRYLCMNKPLVLIVPQVFIRFFGTCFFFKTLFR